MSLFGPEQYLAFSRMEFVFRPEAKFLDHGPGIALEPAGNDRKVEEDVKESPLQNVESSSFAPCGIS